MKRTLFLILIAITTYSCLGQEKNLPNNFDFGETVPGLYKNSFFEMEITFSPDWIVQDRQQMNNLVETGKEMMTGDDQNLKSAVKASMVNVAYPLTVFKYEVGAAVEFNPSFMVIAENIQNSPGIKNGEDYLFHSKRLLEQSQIEYSFEKEVFEKKLGSLNFHVLEAKLEYMGKTIIQEYITTVTRGFCLSFVASYSNEAERNELYEIINKIKI